VIAEGKTSLRVKISALAAIASLALTAGALKAQTTGDSNGISPGLQEILTDAAAGGRAVSPSVSLPLQTGFFNGALALYITPEVGVDPSAGAAIVAAAQQVASGFHANYIPQNFATLPNTGAVDVIFVFTNFTQGNILTSFPIPAGPTNTNARYSPLWQVNLVTWNSGRQGRVLRSQADVLSAVAAGDVSVSPTPIIVECSVIFTPQGGLLPLARVQVDRSAQTDPR
jgi:hypothetical protein